MKKLTRSKKATFALGLLAATAVITVATLAACSTANDSNLAPMPVVDKVDVARYLGTWHQVAWIPNSFQGDCATDTKATYTLDGKDLRVQNQCKDAKGKTTEAVGIAKIVEGSNNAKLRVSFFRPFYGNYWVLALDPNTNGCW